VSGAVVATALVLVTLAYARRFVAWRMRALQSPGARQMSSVSYSWSWIPRASRAPRQAAERKPPTGTEPLKPVRRGVPGSSHLRVSRSVRRALPTHDLAHGCAPWDADTVWGSLSRCSCNGPQFVVTPSNEPGNIETWWRWVNL